MSSKTLSFLAIGLWVLTLGAFALVMMRGSVVPSEGDRTAIELSPEHREVVHRGMTNFFAVVSDLNLALAQGEMGQIPQIARRAGGAALAEIPTGLMTQLPAGFKQAGFAVHSQFEDLAQRAAEGEPTPQEVQLDLRAIMENCARCHSRYKIVEARP